MTFINSFIIFHFHFFFYLYLFLFHFSNLEFARLLSPVFVTPTMSDPGLPPGTVTVRFMATRGQANDPLVGTYSRFMSLLSQNRNAAWTAIGALIVVALFIVYVWQPYVERRALAKAEAERVAQSRGVRADAQRLASIAEQQARADVDTADAEARRLALEREKRLRKLQLDADNLAGHRLGSAVSDDNNDDDNSSASTSTTTNKKNPTVPPPPKKPKAVLRRTGVNLMSGGDSSSSCGFKPSGSMRNINTGKGG